MFNPVEFGNNIKRIRLERNLTLEQLAELSNISPSHLFELEKGAHTPSVRIIISLINSLGVNFGELMEESDADSKIDESIVSMLYKADEKDIKLFGLVLDLLNEGEDQ